ncbi:hypothetical protein E2562_010092 [Oryza meyeriana var. granulata]|uniref:RING-type domain-containing protein n=1 Tax=Oryza meyeriana var. granulata TaxID=110450 RepID=A0A6G1EH71_9ORYZ|nr:hypothetical protein E2562_010092 [Oryza meyeriana var. granulata]
MQPCGRRLLGGGAAPPPVSAGLGSGHSMDRAQREHMERVLGVTTTVLFVASVSYIALTALYACFCDGGGARRDDDGAARDSSSVPPEPSEETKRALKGIPVHVVVHLARDADEETSSMEEGGGDCAVCLAEYAAGDEVRVLPACRHGFHRECVDRWLLTRAPTCPVCRAPVVARN